jgi:hypothetical protein
MNDPTGFEGIERRAREVFDASVAAMDTGTRSRLHRARQRALARASRPARAVAAPLRWSNWAPVGALAAAVLAAALLLRGPLDGGDARPGPTAATPATLTQGTIEIIAAGDEFEIATSDEALEFYRWAEQATANVGKSEGQS